MDGGNTFILSTVRQQKNGQHCTKGSEIAEEFGHDALLYLEPFLRAYIPKMYNMYPMLTNSTTFSEKLILRVTSSLILPYEEIYRFLGFGIEKKKNLAQNLFSLYEQHCLLNCRLIYEELKNPSFQGFGLYSQAPLLLSSSTSISGFYYERSLEARTSFEDMMASSKGPFGLFFDYIQETFQIDPEVEQDLNPLIQLFKLKMKKETLPLYQPVILLFGVLHGLNRHYSKDTHSICPFLKWKKIEEFRTTFNILYTSTILFVIHSQFYKEVRTSPVTSFSPYPLG
jgi:hypothetical protein